ncbi:MAG: DUF2589 domain-containing protein [Oscillospiraceae bacterium]|nr:DUF2589 domain-containing protein [Oscillospiraceae bacterium]
MEIDDLITEFGKAVTNAQQKIEMNYIASFFKYFKPVKLSDEDMGENAEDDTSAGSEILKPATVKIELPCADDISHYAPVEVPLVALVHHRQVSLNKVTVRVKPRFTKDTKGGIIADMNAPVFNTANSLENTDDASRDDMGEIELVFNAADSSEGISRVVQDISKII